MAEIVGIYAATHTPVMMNFPDQVESGDREHVYGAFRELGARIAAAKPDVIVAITDDHIHNFFLNNFPAFCIGAADSYKAPIEPWLAAEKRVLPGDDQLGAYLLGEALESGFDPSFSMDLTLDHGTLTPLELAGVAHATKVVPIMVNCVQPPMPLMSRCLDFGRFLGRAIGEYDGCSRVAILATGGLSHDVGTPRMGMVNQEFDREFLRLLARQDDSALLDYSNAQVNEAGNGTEEIRTWLIARGIAGPASLDVITYRALPKWYIGVSLVEWQVRHAAVAGLRKAANRRADHT